MYIVHVFVHVKPESIEAFKAASLDNASNSVQEPGVARFDVIQQQDDPTRFVLLEVYRDSEQAPAAHKQTAHYARWRDAVAEMMAEPRYAIKYNNIFPNDPGWG
jgi:quinol monooxygenase YgiN